MAKKKGNLIGSWAFTIAALVAIIAGLVQPAGSSAITFILVAAGIIVGLLNITAKEVVTFLVATIALIASAQFISILPALGMYIQAIFTNVVIFVALAAIVVALKAVYAVAAAK